ncbi:GNAT family N-acetyltransferase [Solimonas sp. K1W22B-7]|uniref:GNAT family N-acetyltransferase n=1 Tax=Solimonas sp. K1W22B-7 TaxID=2303331 RepID=UPI000E3378A1|nr:GNAT family N-acetyltransferase [Solimonas sp. K1W22B-7]AXQ29146.1 GNAT family N-acetyltransferase [Solimonas sp. K1W22B-7]
MRLRQVGRIADVPAPAWDALFPPDYPFTRHGFLSTLESQRCVGDDSGWDPCHLLAENQAGELVGAVPLYWKQHSYGEFVFDFGWAEASHRMGRRYYPKLLCAIPYTPATGPRLGARDPAVRATLAARLAQLGGGDGAPSLHALFAEEVDQASLRAAGMLERQDIQFHWFNRGYAGFEDFLEGLRSDKRKKIRQERRRVAEAGIGFEWRSGHELRESEWQAVYGLYANTYEERGQAPYLSLPFLQAYGAGADSPLRFALAYDGTRMVAMAMTLRGGDTLYGRHWGTAGRYHALHFEACYYQGIDYCIREGLRRYDAGTQGEHKLARGFVPVRTRSAHVLADERLHKAVAAHLQRETAFVELRHSELLRHVPYKEGVAS